ncbi:hypothetical protein [Variovorax sp.]|uniref:hypothetical protein n=1 Tax=Variovorax sp. TaxID=1871043 RepID=UPI0025CE1EBD|nr:hypothetical protein [Variovorax sp.]
MGGTKGPLLEELVRDYFGRQGYFALRSVLFQFDGDDVTDVDVWLYSRHAASARVRAIVDVKNKKSPKAFERVLWIKGLQTALHCDRAFIATTDATEKLMAFANSVQISVLSKGFLDRLEKKLTLPSRLSLEEFLSKIQSNPAQKQDGDWIRAITHAKSALISRPAFPAFNSAISTFRFFAERAEVRAQHRDAAIRATWLCASLACIALDAALQRLVFEDGDRRFRGIIAGVNFGDSGDGKTLGNIQDALSVLTENLQNGRAIAAQARAQLDQRIAAIRAEIIAEYFVREANAQHLFSVAKELDDAAHAESLETTALSLDAKSILGVYADFVGVKRASIYIDANSQSRTSEYSMKARLPGETHLVDTSLAIDDESLPGTSPTASGRQKPLI